MIEDKLVSKENLIRELSKYRSEGKIIAFTNGCFDLMHLGHVKYLEKAKAQNRILIVGLNSDASIKRIKGENRPINDEVGRASVLAALDCVDFVCVFEDDTPLDLIQCIQPDVLIKGADWKDKGVIGSDVVEAAGGEVEFIEFEKGYSTTGIIERILKVYGR